jgi:transposase
VWSRCALSGTLADAIRYSLVRWDNLTRFLDDGRIELDTNAVERAIRPVAEPLYIVARPL